jgi:hypothetical protein
LYGVKKMDIEMKVHRDSNEILEIEDQWNKKIELSSDNPFYYSRLICQFIKYWQSQGWIPIIFTFWKNDNIIGVIPLKIKKKIFVHSFYSLADDLFSNLILDEEYAKICLKKMMNYLFKNLKCTYGSLTIQNPQFLIDHLKFYCKKQKLFFSNYPTFKNAIIPIETTFDKFYSTLKPKIRKEFRRIKRKLDKLKSWRISNFKINPTSIKTIYNIEKSSWKTKWREKNKIEGDYKLNSLLKASSIQKITPIYQTEVFFLQIENKFIAYDLVLFFKNKAIITKSTYSMEFKQYSPGKFLINATIKRIFQNKNIKKIDFITSLPFLQTWNPRFDYRITFNFEKNFLFFIIKSISRKIMN